MKTRGFTLIELLVVIVILSILITLGFKGLSRARMTAKKAQAQVEMKSIETAVMAYFNKYGKLPSEEFSADTGLGLVATDNSALISVLTVEERDNPLNPANIIFLEQQSAGSSRYVDPWGYDYIIGLDTDYDGILITVDGDELRRKVAVISIGLYKTLDRGNANDYIFSWQ